jgi:hypothetical protein
VVIDVQQLGGIVVGAASSRDIRFSNKRPIAAESRSHNFCFGGLCLKCDEVKIRL